jgi:hypothetical protein
LLECRLFAVVFLDYISSLTLSPAGLQLRLRGRQMSDGHARAVQPQPLGELTAGQTLEDTPLNPEWRRGVGANIHQAHLSATRQTLHGYPPIWRR